MWKALKIIILLLLMANLSQAQYNNSWIDYSKTYYKFKIHRDTLCRITQPVLSGLGLAGVNADHFQLWRNGKEVRLYTTVTNSPLGTSDYIEFIGERNDGKADRALYRDPDFQLADKHSLETDTAAYFLTINTAGNNLRYTTAVNTAPSASAPDTYFMRNVDYYFNAQMNRGEAKVVGEYVYSSAYDPGEGWTSNSVSPCCDLGNNFTGLNVYNAGPANSLSVRVNVAGNAPNYRDLKIKLNQTEITAAPYGSPVSLPYFEYRRININNLPLSLFQNVNSMPVYVNGNSANSFDRIVVASLGLTYPATFNFNNSKSFSFSLDTSAAGRYIVIDNFNYGATAPLLFDVTNGLRYMGEILSTPGKVKFKLQPASAPVSYVLYNQENPQQINGLVSRQFLDVNATNQQSNYIIISNPLLYNDGAGNDYVNQYKDYRSSAAGGGFVAKVYDIDELTDQFAFGITKHPDAIRNFIQFAAASFAQRPEYVFLIGRGVNYVDQKMNAANPVCQQTNLVPTFGWPASDILLSSPTGICNPTIPIGRLAAVTPQEVNNYLSKVKEYELAQSNPSPLIADKAWMKTFIHVVGGKDSLENQTFRNYMNEYKRTAEDTLLGASVETFTKTSTGAVQQANSQRIEQLFDQGLGFVGYFGHSSANTFEFNLSNPEIYTNAGKYPFFNVSGCSAGNFYVFDPLRLSGNLSLSEKYVLANQRGSIGFMADTHFGIPPFLNQFNDQLYKNFSRLMYGNTIGNQHKAVIQYLNGQNPGLDFFTRIHLEEINLHGDPAIRVNSAAKPDFAIEEPLVKISPNIISVADNNFSLKISMMNIGAAVNDSMRVIVKRQLPNDSIRILYNSRIAAIRFADSLSMTVPIYPTTDKGLNKIIVLLDADNNVDEAFETNNTVTKEFYIFEDELRPAYPYNYSIINRQNITFSASTANPLSGQRSYTMEVDTTALFNSAFKKTYNQSGPGGLVQFVPINLNFTDSTVYYWRVSMVPLNGAQPIWNTASFIYLASSSTGFNQSHYFQMKQSDFNDVKLDNDRVYRFVQEPKDLIIRTGLFPYYNYDNINVNLDFTQLELYGCISLPTYRNLQFYVFDTTTLMPWRNRNVSATNGLYGSRPVCQNGATPNDTTRAFFEYIYSDPVYRKKAMEFIDLVPDGMYVAITNLGSKIHNNTFINQWQDDTLTLGSGNSLYHKLKSIGFTKIDSFTRNLPFLYFYRKGRPDYTPTQIIGPFDSSYIDQTFELNSTKEEGMITSPWFGPAGSWTSLHWRGSSNDPVISDTVKVDLWGQRTDGITTYLATMYPAQDTLLDFVDAQEFPLLQLKTTLKDERYVTPQQLRYLRLNATLVPEGAVAPGILFSSNDTVEQGEPLNFALTFKNISEVAFDSLIKVKFIITDRYNIPHEVIIPKRKALVAGDTLNVMYAIDTRDLIGNNTIFVEFNPDNDQPEQYHFNNILYKDFHVKADLYNPLLDVTFDGVHILNKDIISSKPMIHVELKDESRFMALKDTSLVKLQVRYPDQTLHTFHFGDTMSFTPASLSAGNNTASIDLKPYFPEDGEYELMVSGKDEAGNKAGNLDYRIVFNVINKPMISNLLNYPNPFTSSTSFVFTLTGSDIPQQLRIQILTITGKVVKEISRNELGPLHIGRNITAYKWDGTDMYGQRLGNGVYLYRVITNLNGNKLDKFRNQDEDTDKYFNRGYGKMYLMR